MQRKKGISLAAKLNLIVIAAIVVVSVGLVWLSFHIYCKKVDDTYRERMRDAYEMTVYSVDADAIERLWTRVQSDEFAQVREEALAAQDESIIFKWLMTQEISGMWAIDPDNDGVFEVADGDANDRLNKSYTNLYDVYVEHESLMERASLSAHVASAYIQVMKDGVTYTLVDPEFGFYGLGEIEDPLPEFAGYADNERVPMTVYNSKYGWLATMCEPIYKAGNEEPVAMLCFDADMNDVMAERWSFVIQSIVYVLLISAVAMAVSVYLIRRFATKPLKEITEAASGFCDVDDEDLESSLIDVDITSNDEIGELCREIRGMEERIVEHTDNMARLSAEKERVKAEMEMAGSIQESMLPSSFPCFPERDEFDIFASMDPAKEVGGDFYDFFLIDDDHLALVIADVSGKGIPAALFMMSAKIMIADRAQAGGSPAEILAAVNAQVCENNPTKTFLSVWMGILDTKTGIMTCSNAGHLYPFIGNAQGGFEMVRDKHGLVLGGVKRMKYADYTIELAAGDTVFVYTDGVTEARNPEGEFFGYDRLGDALAAREDPTPEATVKSVKAHVAAFEDGAEPFDDLTMLCLEYRGCGRAGEDAITLPAAAESIPEVISFVSERLDALGSAAKAKIQITVAIDEIMSNIARDAYEEGEGSVRVAFSALEDGAVAEITFTDQGRAFNPLEVEDPDVTLKASERKAGGLGVFLVKKSMDDVVYERAGSENVLSIRKRIKD